MDFIADEKAGAVALLSDLVQVVADVQGMEPVSVGIFARAAREAGFIAQKGRGRGAAHMSTRDAANLLIAVNGSALAKEVPIKIPQFRALNLHRTYVWLRSRAIKDLVAEYAEFGDQLEALIERAKRPVRGRSELDQALRSSYRQTDAKYAKQRDLKLPEPRLEVQFQLPFPAASIRLWSPGEAIRDRTYPSIHLQEKARSEYRLEDEENDTDQGDRWSTITITQRTLTAVAQRLQE